MVATMSLEQVILTVRGRRISSVTGLIVDGDPVVPAPASRQASRG